jgi:hypothetical protein
MGGPALVHPLHTVSSGSGALSYLFFIPALQLQLGLIKGLDPYVVSQFYLAFL